MNFKEILPSRTRVGNSGLTNSETWTPVCYSLASMETHAKIYKLKFKFQLSTGRLCEVNAFIVVKPWI